MDTIKSFRIPEEQGARLQKLKQQTGVPVSELVRRAITLYLDRIRPAPGGIGVIDTAEQQAE